MVTEKSKDTDQLCYYLHHLRKNKNGCISDETDGSDDETKAKINGDNTKRKENGYAGKVEKNKSTQETENGEEDNDN